MIYALMIFAVLLALIIMYNLGLLSFLEMERDIGTLKVLGFKTADLTKLLLTQSLAFIIIGGLLRIPLAYKVLEKAWESSSEKFFAVPSISLTNLAESVLPSHSVKSSEEERSCLSAPSTIQPAKGGLTKRHFIVQVPPVMKFCC